MCARIFPPLDITAVGRGMESCMLHRLKIWSFCPQDFAAWSTCYIRWRRYRRRFPIIPNSSLMLCPTRLAAAAHSCTVMKYLIRGSDQMSVTKTTVRSKLSRVGKPTMLMSKPDARIGHPVRQTARTSDYDRITLLPLKIFSAMAKAGLE